MVLRDIDCLDPECFDVVDMTTEHLDSLIRKLTDCRSLEHGETVSEEEFDALVNMRNGLSERPIDDGDGQVIEEVGIR